jgi:hypothetical protein
MNSWLNENLAGYPNPAEGDAHIEVTPKSAMLWELLRMMP